MCSNSLQRNAHNRSTIDVIRGRQACLMLVMAARQWMTTVVACLLNSANELTGPTSTIWCLYSYQAADDNIPYHGTLRGVRIISEVNELYGEWTVSRLRVLAAQAAALADKVQIASHKHHRLSLPYKASSAGPPLLMCVQ